MKSPLRYQVTQYDCGPTTMTNAILYLFEREEIPCEDDGFSLTRAMITLFKAGNEPK